MAYSFREDFPGQRNPELDQPFTRKEWDASNFASEEDLQWFRDARYGMFIHFGLSTYINKDLSWGVCYTRKAPDAGNGPIPDEEWQSWRAHFRLEHFDAEEWVSIAQEAQAKYLVLITKHHDGFHMWDTAESDFKITNTPFGRDVVAEVVDACHKAGMPVGLYYSQRDWYHPDYKPVDPDKVERNGIHWTLKPGYDSPLGECHQKYLDYQERAIRELCTRYGKIDIFWWDAGWVGNMFTAEMWDAERVNRIIRELQPGIIINNRCSIPGDFDTPEGRLGNFRNHRPWESCFCFAGSWSYSGSPPKTLDVLVKMLTNNICGDGNLLLSWGPHWDGEFDPVEKARFLEFGRWIKAHEDTLFGTRGGPWKCNSWGGAVYRENTVYLHITNLPGRVLELPVVPERKVLTAHYLDGTPATIAIGAETMRLLIAEDKLDALDTIIRLEMDGPLDGVPAVEGWQTLFTDITTYGQPVEQGITVTASSCASDPGSLARLGQYGLKTECTTSKENQPWIQLDLGEVITVTGVRVEFTADRKMWRRVHAFVSPDGSTWQDCGELDQPFDEIFVNSYQAGCWIPGADVRFIKIQVITEGANRALGLSDVTVFAKKNNGL